MSNGTGTNSTVAKTFFVVLHDKAISNMGIEVNWDNMEKMKADMETAFKDVSPNFYAAICKSEQGVIHTHLAITFPKSKRFGAVTKLLGNAHTEIMRGTKEEAIKYVNKEGHWKEKGEIILAKIGDPSTVEDNSGERINWDSIRQDILKGNINATNINNWALTLGRTPTAINNIKTYYRQVLDTIPSKRDSIKVIYVEGDPGSGKTFGAYERYTDIFKASTDDKATFPFDGYMGEKTLLLNELRPGMYKPSNLFEILDPYPYTVNVKGGHIKALWDTVIITTSFPLSQWFTSKEDNTGQDNNRKQFTRRITEHYKAVVLERDEQGHTTKSKWVPYEEYWKEVLDSPINLDSYIKKKYEDKIKEGHDTTSDFRQLTVDELEDLPFK